MKETAYLLKANILMAYFTTYLPYYFSFKIGNVGADKIWVLVWINFIFQILFHIFKVVKTYKKSAQIIYQKDFI